MRHESDEVVSVHLDSRRSHQANFGGDGITCPIDEDQRTILCELGENWLYYFVEQFIDISGIDHIMNFR